MSCLAVDGLWGAIEEVTDSTPPTLGPQGKGAKRHAAATYAAPTTYAATGDVVTCNTLINFCAKNKQVDSALHIVEAMHQQGVLPNQSTYNALMRAHNGANKPEAMFGQPSLNVPGLWHGYDIRLTANNTNGWHNKLVRNPTMEEHIKIMKQVAFRENPTPKSRSANVVKDSESMWERPKKMGCCF